MSRKAQLFEDLKDTLDQNCSTDTVRLDKLIHMLVDYFSDVELADFVTFVEDELI